MGYCTVHGERPTSSAIPLAGAAWCLALTASGVLGAQEANNNDVLEEVTVTAQRRLENLLDVPLFVTLLSAEGISRSGLFELGQIADYIPNVYIRQNSDFHARIVIRGVGAHSRNIGFDTRVGVYLDGVYLGQSPAVNQNLVDLEHIEVLRGPQGTLFGKNSVAGAIVLVSEKPQPEWAFNASANVYSYDGLELTANANIPLGDRAAARIYVSDREDAYSAMTPCRSQRARKNMQVPLRTGATRPRTDHGCFLLGPAVLWSLRWSWARLAGFSPDGNLSLITG